MSGINGLSDVGIQRLAYSKENNMLLIAYQNSNIDLLIGNTIYNPFRYQAETNTGQ